MLNHSIELYISFLSNFGEKPNMRITKSYLNELTFEINNAAIEVHKALGPGLLENVYHQCLIHELHAQNIPFESEMVIPIQYKGLEIKTDLRCDLLIDQSLIVEIKAVKEIAPIHKAQLLTYMKLLPAPKGIMYNFNVANLFYEGQQTFVNHLFTNLQEY